FKCQARWEYLTESVTDLLGWDPSDLRDHLFFELVHPDELSQVQQLHQETVLADKAAAVVYMRLKHKNAHQGYLLCAVVSDLFLFTFASISFASPGGKALHSSSTAQEITVVTPTASNFEFRASTSLYQCLQCTHRLLQRWHEPAPITSRLQSPPQGSASQRSTNTLDPATPAALPAAQSFRTALILDRFSVNCTVTYYSNHQLISPAAATPRPFFDLVAAEDEATVRSWLEAIKTCGVNDHGHPSNGGFGYGRFLLCPEGRGSTYAPCSSLALPSRT
ncbi:hypothetical protein B0H15DRAFT_788823, partial [Mycena belliarum]